MQPCAFANAITGGALLLIAAFAGCGGATETPAESPEGVEPEIAVAETPAAEEPIPDDPPTEERFDEADPADGEDAATEPSSTGSGRNPADIQKVILANRDPIRKCYEDAYEKSKGIKGTLTMTLVLRPDGTVKSAMLNKGRSDIVTPAVVDCAAKILLKLDFGPHERGMESTVNYPFDFKPTQ